MFECGIASKRKKLKNIIDNCNGTTATFLMS